MKNIARLAVFFSMCFILIFVTAAVFRFLVMWIEAARIMPFNSEYSGTLITALSWAVPFGLYVSILLALSYSARLKIPVFLSVCGVIVLAAAFTTASSLGIRQAERLNFAIEIAPPIRARPGLILSRAGTAMVLLEEDGIDGGRVLSFPGEDLLYRGEAARAGGAILTPALPFGGKIPWFIQSIIIDFTLCARQLDTRLGEGLLPFSLYAGALILLLASIRFFLEFSVWPLANLFLGAMIFRGILALETFLDTREIQYLLSSFLGNRFGPDLMTPLAFSCLGLFILVYTLFAKLARGKAEKND